jgi:hypothetical protein
MLSISDTSAAAGIRGSAAVDGRDAIDDEGGVVVIASDCTEGAGDCSGNAGTDGVNGAACNGVCA